MKALGVILHILWKDLACEYRSRKNFSSVLFFSLLVLVIFNFVFEPGSPALKESSAAILWVAFTFAGVISLNSSFAREEEDGALQGLLMSPVDRSWIYLGKFSANLVLLGINQGLIFPIFCVFFNLSPWRQLPALLLVVVLTDIGFSAVGTLFAAMASALRTREIMLPVLLFPIIVPIIIASVKSTSMLLDPQRVLELQPWLQILAAFDLVYVALGALVFPYVVEE